MHFVETEAIEFVYGLQSEVPLLATQQMMINHDSIQTIRKFNPDKIIRDNYPNLDASEMIVAGQQIIVNASYDEIKSEIYRAKVALQGGSWNE